MIRTCWIAIGLHIMGTAAVRRGLPAVSGAGSQDRTGERGHWPHAAEINRFVSRGKINWFGLLISLSDKSGRYRNWITVPILVLRTIIATVMETIPFINGTKVVSLFTLL